MIWTINGTKYEFENLKVKTTSLPLLPKRRSNSEYVIGSDSAVVFLDGFENKNIQLLCEFVDGDIFANQNSIRELSGIINQPGELRLSYEPDKKYNARLIDMQQMAPGGSSNVINLTINVDAVAYSIVQEGDTPTWDELDIPWELCDFPWNGGDTVFSGTGTHTVTNRGNYKTLPIIRLSASSGDVTLTLGDQTFTYTGLTSEPVNVDSQTMTVYTDALENKKQNHSGDSESLGFISLQPGENDIIISGSAVGLSVEYKYSHTWI